MDSPIPGTSPKTGAEREQPCPGTRPAGPEGEPGGRLDVPRSRVGGFGSLAEPLLCRGGGVRRRAPSGRTLYRGDGRVPLLLRPEPQRIPRGVQRPPARGTRDIWGHLRPADRVRGGEAVRQRRVSDSRRRQRPGPRQRHAGPLRPQRRVQRDAAPGPQSPGGARRRERAGAGGHPHRQPPGRGVPVPGRSSRCDHPRPARAPLCGPHLPSLGGPVRDPAAAGPRARVGGDQ
jgi:hypothetical protein